MIVSPSILIGVFSLVYSQVSLRIEPWTSCIQSRSSVHCATEAAAIHIALG